MTDFEPPADQIQRILRENLRRLSIFNQQQENDNAKGISENQEDKAFDQEASEVNIYHRTSKPRGY